MALGVCQGALPLAGGQEAVAGHPFGLVQQGHGGAQTAAGGGLGGLRDGVDLAGGRTKGRRRHADLCGSRGWPGPRVVAHRGAAAFLSPGLATPPTCQRLRYWSTHFGIDIVRRCISWYHDLMATKPKPKKGRPGRPAKSPAGPATAQVNLKLTAEEDALLAALQEREQARIDSLGAGLPVHVGRADTLRIALLREAARQGLVDAAVAKAS